LSEQFEVSRSPSATGKNPRSLHALKCRAQRVNRNGQIGEVSSESETPSPSIELKLQPLIILICKRLKFQK